MLVLIVDQKGLKNKNAIILRLWGYSVVQKQPLLIVIRPII